MASHDLTKFVDANGDEFNVRDTTKQPVADRVTSWSSTPSDTKYPSEKLVKDSLDGIAGDYRTKDQDISKGANLVVNGSGTMMSNYNFSDCTFVADADLPLGIAGAFHRSYNNIFQNEFIQLNTEKAFYAEAWYRVKTANKSTVRLSLACYDIDKNAITAINICYGAGTLTELTQDLNPGDTVVHLADLSNSAWKSETTHHKGFIFWNYVNSLGYTYPPETYSRNVYPENELSSLWEDSTKVDEVNGTITLKSPWSGPVVPAGTKVSRRSSGSTYYYIASSASAGASTEWTKLSGKFSGFASGGTAIGAFKQGAAFFKLAWINAYTSGNEWIEFAGIELRELPDRISTARKLKTNLGRTADSTFDGSADQLNIPVTGTLPVGNGGTGKTSVTAGRYVVGAGTSALVEKTPKDVGSDVLSHLDMDDGNVVEDDYIIGSYHVNETTISNNLFVRRSAVKLWNYIKSKLSGSNVNIGGNATTATTAQDYDTSTGTIKSALAGKSNTGHVHNTDANEVTDSAVASTLDVVTDTTEIVTTNTAGYGNSSTQDKKLYRRPIKSKLWPWIKGLLSSDTGVNVSGSSASCTGNAATASAAASGSALETAINGKAASSHTHKTDAADVTSDNTNLGDATDGMQFVTTYADDTGYSSQHKELYRRPGIKIWNWIKSKIDSYTGVVHTTGNEEIAGTKTFFNTTQGIDFDVNVQSVTNSGTHKISVGIGLSGNRGLWDYGGSGSSFAGEGNWIVHKDPDNVIHVGDDSAQRSKVKIGGITLDFSGTVGTAANTLYIV